MRIALAQIDTTVGDFEGNLRLVRDAAWSAAKGGARLVVAPELAVTGYLPRDFLEQPEFVTAAREALVRFVASDLPRDVAILVGSIEPHDGEGAGLYNTVFVVENGQVVARARKTLLPTYDVFDEGRYFDTAPAPGSFAVDGVRIGVAICEDLWNDKLFWPRRRYDRDPVEELARAGAQVIVSPSASPYAVGKPELRERMIGAAASHRGLPIVVTNLVGGNDALVFDGRSFAVNASGVVTARAASMASDLLFVDVEPAVGSSAVGSDLPEKKPIQEGPARGESTLVMTPRAEELTPGQLDEMLAALVLGTRDYAQKTGFRTAVLGLSGGIDSALVAVVAARALGPGQVTTVSMPSRYTAAMSNDDAAVLAQRLGVRHLHLPIEDTFRPYLTTLSRGFDGKAWDVTEENLQARVRGGMIMALSNKHGHLVLTTGNKSELATGYCTLYGDMCGGLAVIGDVPKTIVYAICRRINDVAGAELIPERILTRPPSAELRENQTDQDSLPPYEVLDRILRRLVEARESATAIAAAEPDIARGVIDRIVRLVRRNEYKRRQAAPVLRVTPRAFGEGWRYPIAHAAPG